MLEAAPFVTSQLKLPCSRKVKDKKTSPKKKRDVRQASLCEITMVCEPSSWGTRCAAASARTRRPVNTL
ncbi:hypothetical protein V5799_023759 [Amblyomma americanum]|uniref:Uncharacterized protein n=1 Tax=Amblyomma americanum TaxID=6943 RepID=A0AAQ4FHN4_AMBAM